MMQVEPVLLRSFMSEKNKGLFWKHWAFSVIKRENYWHITKQYIPTLKVSTSKVLMQEIWGAVDE